MPIVGVSAVAAGQVARTSFFRPPRYAVVVWAHVPLNWVSVDAQHHIDSVPRCWHGLYRSVFFP